MPKITIYTTSFCGWCVRAKMILKRNNLPFEEIDASDKREWLEEQSGQRTVPQIWIGNEHIGGCEDLMALEAAGGLERLKSEAL